MITFLSSKNIAPQPVSKQHLEESQGDDTLPACPAFLPQLGSGEILSPHTCHPTITLGIWGEPKQEAARERERVK